jgi:hypothetical protein
MKLPALAFLLAASAAHQREHIGVVSLESGPPPPEDADSQLRTQADARKSGPSASAVSTSMIERERSPETGSEVPTTGKGEVQAAKAGAAPSSFVERRSEVRSACILSRKFRNQELVAAEEEDMCASVTTAKECMYIEACEWNHAVGRELSRDRSFLQAQVGPEIRMDMKKYCQVKAALTIDQLTASGLDAAPKAEEICSEIETEDACKSNNLCRFGCFPPECGCFLSEAGMLQAKMQDQCDPFMFDEEACMRTAGICDYRNAGLIFGFPALVVVAMASVSLLCLAACCFYCIVNCKGGGKHRHHRMPTHHAPAEEEEHEEEWEEHH